MRKLLFFFSFVFLFLSSNSNSTFAANDFSTAYNIVYSVHEDGITHANFAVSLKNLTHDYYASSYTVKLGFQNLTNVTASDPDGPITPEVKKTQDGYSITLAFNKKVVGLDKSLPFTLSFDTSGVAKKTGQIWEINIPGIGNQEHLDNLHVHVNVPSSFGAPTFIKPQVTSSTLDFTKEQLHQSGISLTFGKEQIYDFSLTYHLENKNLFPVTEDIALPPSTGYQNVFIEDINPKPLNVVQDDDGNWLATYYFSPSKKLTVMVKGKAYVSLVPKQEFLISTQKHAYLQNQPYWQTTDTRIQQLAKTLKTPEEIYNYVRQTLTYDFSRVITKQKRLGAAEVVNNPTSAVCLEFTDLFIALSRAAGIPARELDGFAYTQNARQRPLSLVQDVLHAWPEYYDNEKNAWIMVDPTWGNTTGGVDYFHTLDYDHVVFAIKGISSTFPFPAGGYKLDGEEKVKDVDVHFGSDTAKKEPLFTSSYNLPTVAFSFLPVQGTIVIKNTGQRVVPPQTITIDSPYLLPHHQELVTNAIPPYGTITLPFRFEKAPLLTNMSTHVTIHVGGASINRTITIRPFFQNIEFLLIGGIAIACISIIIFISTARTRRV